MKKIATNAFLCLLLSGCTFNQYGPSLVMNEREIILTQEVSVDQVDESGGGGVELKQAPPKLTTHPTVIAKNAGKHCVPMPVIKDPPKINVEELKRYMNDEDKLAEIFKKDHAALYTGWKAMKKELDAWRVNPNRC